jgi:hypothetical protein
MFSPESSGELNILILPAFGPACEQNHLHPTVLPALDPISGGKIHAESWNALFFGLRAGKASCRWLSRVGPSEPYPKDGRGKQVKRLGKRTKLAASPSRCADGCPTP